MVQRLDGRGIGHITDLGCRVVANPLGYARKGEQAAFDPLRTVRVGAS
jgi:hypothetical protein